MLKIGDKAPDFDTVDQNGNRVRLSNFIGKKVVLYFYPKDNTPGCTKEACNFRDDITLIKNKGAVVLGVSVDGLDSHKRFSEKHNLNFPLLIDNKKEICRKYGTLRLGIISKRVTYIIDEKGKVKHVFQEVSPSIHSKEVLEKL